MMIFFRYQGVLNLMGSRLLSPVLQGGYLGGGVGMKPHPSTWPQAELSGGGGHWSDQLGCIYEGWASVCNVNVNVNVNVMVWYGMV